VLLIGCAPPASDTDNVLVTDDLDRTVSVPTSPNRVLSLAPSLTEILYAAGAGHKVVGVTTADDYPPALTSLPRFSALPVDFEALVALEPDLILASSQINSPQDANTLAAVGLPVYFVDIQTLEGMLQSIRTVGALLDTRAEADHTADSLFALLDSLGTLTASVSSRPSTLFLIGGTTLYAFGKGSYMHSMIALAGGSSVTEDHDMAAPILTDEYVLTRKPEVIVTTSTKEELLLHHPTWNILPAVQKGHIYTVEGAHFLRPGPRLVLGAWQLAALLHPDRL